VWTGGFPCTGFARPGERVGRSDAGWGEFVDVLEEAKRRRPLALLFENVPGLLTAEKGEVWIELQARVSDAGYDMIHGVADAKDFGFAVCRPRLHMLCLRRDVAEVVELGTFEVPALPFQRQQLPVRVVADALPQPRGGVGEGVVDFHDFAAHRLAARGEKWAVDWLPEFRTEEQRRAFKRPRDARDVKLVRMGYVRREGSRLHKRTG
jgi:site-specific DNA-cytosine methylase